MIVEAIRGFDPDGLLGGYSIAFDLLSKEYGWTDEQIMELPIQTFRQKLAAINRRLYLDRRERIALMSWQTRMLAQYIAGGYWVEGTNKALEQASMLAFDKIEEHQLKENKIRETALPKDFDPFSKEIPEHMLDDLQQGSFERISGLMDPGRWQK